MPEPLLGNVPKRAVINASSAGDNVLVAAVPGKRLRVISYVLVASAPVTVKWRSAVNDQSGPMALAANGVVSSDDAAAGVLRTNAGEALQLNLGTAVQVGGHLTYVEVE